MSVNMLEREHQMHPYQEKGFALYKKATSLSGDILRSKIEKARNDWAVRCGGTKILNESPAYQCLIGGSPESAKGINNPNIEHEIEKFIEDEYVLLSEQKVNNPNVQRQLIDSQSANDLLDGLDR